MITRDVTATLSALRPLFAWGAGVVSGSAFGAALWRLDSDSGNVWYAIPIAIVLGGFTAPFAALGVWAAHRFKLDRPVADIVGGALIATVTFLPFTAFGPPLHIIAEAGACAGLCYWLAAGCPRAQR